MAKQATLTTLTSVNNNIATLNANFTALNTALLNTFSLDGSTPNALNGDIDLNSNDLLNGGAGAFASLTIAGQSVAPSELVVAGSLLAANNLSDVDSASTARTNLGLEIGSDVQAYDANLPTWPAGVTATEVDYLDGVTSDIQTQLNAKAASSHTHDHTDITDYDTELAGKTNTTAFTPSADYHPATKKYVDDNTGSSGATLLTAQATTSGTSKDFTIPSGATQIKVLFRNVSLNGSDNLLVQLGDSGGIETTGYDARSVRISNTTIAGVHTTSGFPIHTALAGTTLSGVMTIDLMDATNFIWVSSHNGINTSSTSVTTSGAGDKALSAELTTVRVTRDGSNTFDVGSVSVQYL